MAEDCSYRLIVPVWTGEHEDVYDTDGELLYCGPGFGQEVNRCVREYGHRGKCVTTLSTGVLTEFGPPAGRP